MGGGIDVVFGPRVHSRRKGGEAWAAAAATMKVAIPVPTLGEEEEGPNDEGRLCHRRLCTDVPAEGWVEEEEKD